MRFGFGFAALACAVSLVACSPQQSGAIAPLKTTPEQAEAYVTKLAETPFTLKAEGAADVASVRDALPKEISLTWGALNFDAASGATVLTDVKLTPKDMPQVGLGVAELRLWDFDAAFAKARLTGQRLAESGKLARRIDAKGIKLFGIETLMNPAMDATASAVESAVERQAGPDAAAQIDASFEMKLEGYEFSVGRLIYDDVMLRPFELKPVQLPADNEFAEAMPILQQLAAIMRTFAADTTAMLDAKGKLSMKQGDEAMAFDFGVKSYGVRGIRGADSDTGFIRGVTYSALMQEPSMPKPIPISGGVDLITTEGVRLDKVMGHLAQGTWPARTEADLLSLGKTVAHNERIDFNGKNFYSVEEATFDASGWYWWIPTKLRLSASNAVYHIDSIMDIVSDMEASMPDRFPTATPPASSDAAMMASMMDLLKKYGLIKPSMDFTLGWDWNPTTGATVVDGAFGLDNYLRTDLKYEGGLPNFKSVSDLVPDDPEKADMTAIGKVFETASTLKLVEFNIDDEGGGLNKIYALTAEAFQLMPDDPTGGMMKGQTPETLRNLVSSSIYTLAETAEQSVPGTKTLIAPFGAFFDKGGKVTFTARPAKPLAIAATSQAVEKGETTPVQFLAALNAKSVHSPPPATAKKP